MNAAEVSETHAASITVKWNSIGYKLTLLATQSIISFYANNTYTERTRCMHTVSRVHRHIYISRPQFHNIYTVWHWLHAITHGECALYIHANMVQLI